jgi:hypothetical protein
MTDVKTTENLAQRRFEGVWIPAELWLDQGLSFVEKVMLAEIRSLETNDRGCYASNSYFAKFFDLSASRVSEIVTSLSNKGRVGVTLIRKGKQVIERQIRTLAPFGIPNTPYSEKAQNPIRKTEEGYSEKAQENNTNIINTKADTLSADADVPAAKKSKTDTDPKFEEAWALYPRREGGSSKPAALKAWNARVREGVNPDVLVSTVKAYAVAMQKAGNIGSRYVKQASTFFGPDRHFEAFVGSGDNSAAASTGESAWWQRAGFEKEWQAINAGCSERYAHLWRDGARVPNEVLEAEAAR